MKISLKINMKMIAFLLLMSILGIVAIIVNVKPLYLFVLCCWLYLMFYAYSDIDNRGMLFAFLIAFFVFLLGRDFLQEFFKYKVENFDQKTQNHAWISSSISLLTIIMVYPLCSKRYKKKISKRKKENKIYTLIAQKISRIVYYFSWVFAVTSKIVVGMFVSARGFTDYYTDYSEYLSGNSYLYIISKMELIMPVAWCIYLATLPSKKQIKIPLILYILYLIVSLGSGQRSTAILGILFVFVYFIYRNGMNSEEKWLTKKMIVGIILILPFLAVFVSAYNIWREGGNASSLNFFEGILNFFYDQGVTGNVLKRAYMYKNQIPKQIYTLEFLHSGILARLFNIKVYHGNTVDHAMYGGSFTHTLGYTVMNSAYLAGRGTGSSYIAELYQDFGYTGIILGNILYSFLLARITKNEDNDSLLKKSIKFMIITQLLWAPRGSFTYFISQNLTPTTIATLLLVFGISYLWEKRKYARKRKYS